MQQILDRLGPGSLVFDVGAHHGDKAVQFLARGARIVCVEPQPSALAILKRRFAADIRVSIVDKAVGDRQGTAEMLVNSRDPVLSTLSRRWTEGRFVDRVWDATVPVAQTTLDSLIVAHGMPDFIKIDVEGYERAALSGLNVQCPALSFEFTSEFFGDAEACLLRLEQLGYRAFNLCLGEKEDFALTDWCDRQALVAHIGERGWNRGDSWGDIYARAHERPGPPLGKACGVAVNMAAPPGFLSALPPPLPPPGDPEDLGESCDKPVRALSDASRHRLMRLAPFDLDGWADGQGLKRIEMLAIGESAPAVLMGCRRRLHRRDIEEIHLAAPVRREAVELLAAYGYGERATEQGQLFVAPRWLRDDNDADWLAAFDLPAIAQSQGFMPAVLHRHAGEALPDGLATPLALALDAPPAAPPAWLGARAEIEMVLAPVAAHLEQWDEGMEAMGFRRIAETRRAACYVRRPRLSMREIGRHGRFGNQVLQHFWFEIARRECDAVAGIAPWVGEKLFDLGEPPRGDWGAESVATPEWPYVASGDMNPFDLDWGFRHLKRARSADVIGNCQYHPSLLRPWRALYRRFMRPHPDLAPRLENALAGLRQAGRTLVVCHLRAGDYGTGEYADHPIFYRAPARWYLDQLDRIWQRLDRPVLYLATDEAAALPREFRRFQPFTAADLALDLGKLDFFVDFYIMCQADILAVANSTFSVTAAMANERACLFLRPDRAAHALIPFDPWNSQIVFFPRESLPAMQQAAGAEPGLPDEERALLAARAASLAAEIASLRATTSWRVTGWLRALVRLARH